MFGSLPLASSTSNEATSRSSATIMTMFAFLPFAPAVQPFGVVRAAVVVSTPVA